MKSLSRLTPLVRIRRSNGGFPAVNRWSSMVSAVIVSGSGYIDPSWPPFGESLCKVVVEDIESSTSDVEDGVGDVDRRGEVLRFLERIFWVIRVWENGRACADNGFE